MAEPEPQPAGQAGTAPNPTPSALPSADDQLAMHALHAWHAFFGRFRADEQDFERQSYLEEAGEINERLNALPAGAPPDAATCATILHALEGFAQRRFAEQNQRIDELMDLCEQMRTRLETSELERTHLDDEFGHCQAIVKAAMKRLDLKPPEGLAHAPRLHNLFDHILAHFEPQAKRMDTASYERVKTPEPAEPPAVFDYDRLRRLFRKG